MNDPEPIIWRGDLTPDLELAVTLYNDGTVHAATRPSAWTAWESWSAPVTLTPATVAQVMS